MRYNVGGVVSEIDSLLGCDQIAVFHNVWTPKDNRGKGCGKVAHEQRLTTARKLGYDFALCTVISTNEKEKSILRTNGWKQVDYFRSSKTDNIVELWSKALIRTEKDTKAEYKTYDDWEKSLERKEETK